MLSRFGLDLEEIYKQGIECDRSDAFPAASIAALGAAGLLQAAAVAPYGTSNRLLARDLIGVAQDLGGSCLSTALIWSMHSQQLHLLTACAEGAEVEMICSGNQLIASVTSEFGSGGNLFVLKQRLQRDGDLVRLSRTAPTVSYGAYAQAYLILMHDPACDEPRFVFCLPTDGKIQVDGAWSAMGVRGTQTVPMTFSLSAPSSRVLAGDHRRHMLSRYVPLGQLLWAASWLGAAQGLLKRLLIQRQKTRTLTRLLESQLSVHRLGRAQVLVDAMQAFVRDCADKYDRTQHDATIDVFTATCQHFNSLKVFVSETATAVARLIQDIEGMRGYLSDTEPRVEQTLRDLLSAPLMFNNDSLLASVALVSVSNNSRAVSRGAE